MCGRGETEFEVRGRIWESAVVMPTTDTKISPDEQLAQRMASLGVMERDLEETFVCSGGRGGQNVNKTATCVMLLHRPSGIRVKIQDARHQGANRYAARALLLDKIETARRVRAAEERATREKARRQSRKPSRAAKQRMLADKSHRAMKKGARRVGALD